jgi:hypothetical protein
VGNGRVEQRGCGRDHLVRGQLLQAVAVAVDMPVAAFEEARHARAAALKQDDIIEALRRGAAGSCIKRADSPLPDRWTIQCNHRHAECGGEMRDSSIRPDVYACVRHHDCGLTERETAREIGAAGGMRASCAT